MTAQFEMALRRVGWRWGPSAERFMRARVRRACEQTLLEIVPWPAV